MVGIGCGHTSQMNVLTLYMCHRSTRARRPRIGNRERMSGLVNSSRVELKEGLHVGQQLGFRACTKRSERPGTACTYGVRQRSPTDQIG